MGSSLWGSERLRFMGGMTNGNDICHYHTPATDSSEKPISPHRHFSTKKTHLVHSTSGVLAAADYSNTFPVDFAVERHAIPVSMTTLKFPLIATCKRYKIFQVLGCLVIQTVGPRHEIPVYLSSCLSCLHHICQLLGIRRWCVSWGTMRWGELSLGLS